MSGPPKDDALTLVDYFVVSGYDAETGLVVEEGTSYGDNAPVDALRPPLQKSFVSKILDYYPKKRRNCPFPPEIISLCMPRGLRFYTEKCVPVAPELHTFANIREDGSRISGTAITFYEEVRDVAVCAAMAALQQEHVRQVTAGERAQGGREHVPPGTVSGGTHTLPRGKRNISKRISYFDGGGGVLYMSKTLCVLSRLPIVGATQTLLAVLQKLAATSSSRPPPLPIESYIYWMLNEVPLPSPGTTLKVRLLDSIVVVQRPTVKELPFFDYSLAAMFEILPMERFLRIFTAFLLEHQILICSKDLSRLMLICESLCCLAFPFRWQLTYVPILPTSQLKFIEAPVPYVMGLCCEDAPPEYLFQSNVCIVDIDTGRIEIPEDLPVFPQHRAIVAEIKGVLERFAERASLEAASRRSADATGGGMRMSRSFDFVDDSPRVEQPRLDDLLRNNDALARTPSTEQDLITWSDEEEPEEVTAIARRAGVKVELDSLRSELDEKSSCGESAECRRYFHDMRVNNAIRECLATRMASIFHSYEVFVLGSALDRDDDNRDSVVCFDKAGFMSDQPESSLPFLAAFLETQMFASYIDAKLLHGIGSPDENVARFDSMISCMRPPTADGGGGYGMTLPMPPPMLATSEDLLARREEQLDYVVPPPHVLTSSPSFATSPIGCVPSTSRGDGFWPVLDAAALTANETMSPMPSPWKQRYARLRPKTVETVRPLSTYGGAGLAGGDSPDAQNAKFVEQLLKETKGKTKRMLVEKLGKEAVELGHGEGLSGVEENTLVAGLCDLLERIWTHGQIKKHGKSSLWSFVLNHEDCEKLTPSHRSNSTSYLAPGPGPKASLPPSLLRRTTSSGVGSAAFGRLPPGAPLPPRPPPPRPPAPPPPSATAPDLSGLLTGMEGGEGGGDDWKSSLLRAATSLVDRMADRIEEKIDDTTRPGGVLANAWGRLNETAREKGWGFKDEAPPRPLGTMRKSSSVSDFTTPSWSSDNMASSAASGGGRSARERSSRERRDPSESMERGRQRSQSRTRSPDGGLQLPPLPQSISYDLKNVLRMSEMKSDLGYARAFVRLALERRLLHKHLQTLLSNNRLLSETHKPYAFARQEDEREQFLMHIMSLNAANFRCFTNTFTKTKMEYQVMLVTDIGGGRARIPPVWLIVEGSLASSPSINLPAGTPFFKFDHRNLGILSTVRIGHVAANPNKWYLECILIRNEITGARYRFACGRYFGRGVDDGSLERLLVAQIVPDEEAPIEQSSVAALASPAIRRGRRAQSRSQTPLRDRSPSTGRAERSTTKMRAGEVEEVLGEAVNALIRHFHANPDGHKRAELAQLLCGAGGLIEAIEAIFTCGRNEAWKARLFGGVYPWDYIEKAAIWMLEVSRRPDWKNLDIGQREMMKQTLRLYQRISANQQLGKEGKFHVFVLVSIRDHTLCGLIAMMAWSPVTQQMYDERSFLRNSLFLERFSKLLDSLFEYSFNIDPSLTYGIV